MTADIRIASLDDREAWHDVQARSGVPSHSWAFSNALSFSEIRPRLASVQLGDSILTIPFYERRFQGEVDICTILSVSGAAMRPASPELLSAWAGFGVAQGWVAGYLQFEPGTDLLGVEDSSRGNSIFMVDLSEADLLADASPIIRRKIRRGASQGAVLVQDRQALAKAVQNLYPKTMARSEASHAYDFSSRTLESWVLDPGSMVVGAARGSSIEAVAVFPVMGDRAEYHLGASSIPGRELSAWLIWQASTRLREAGVKMLNLGGGVRPHDGLYEFKRRFGGCPMPLHAVRQIYRPDVYQRLCTETGVDPDPRTGYFPPYRRRV